MNQPHPVRNTGILCMVRGLTTYPPVILHSYGRSTSFSSMIFPSYESYFVDFHMFFLKFSHIFPYFFLGFLMVFLRFPEQNLHVSISRGLENARIHAAGSSGYVFLGLSWYQFVRGKPWENIGKPLENMGNAHYKCRFLWENHLTKWWVNLIDSSSIYHKP